MGATEATLLHAAEKEELENVESAAPGLPIDCQDSSGNTPLYYAVRRKKNDIVEYLMVHGADAYIKNVRGKTPLGLAVDQMDADIVKILLDNSSDSDHSAEKNILLHIAVRNGDLGSVTQLVRHGADPNSLDAHAKTCFDLAVENQHADIVRVLLNNSSSGSSSVNVNTFLHAAVRNGDLDTVKQLISHGADPNSKNQNGQTPLHLAVAEKQDDIVNYLIMNYADIDNADNSGKTPLMYAVVGHSEGIFALLIISGANPNATDNKGESALSMMDRLASVKVGLGPNSKINSKQFVDNLRALMNRGSSGSAPATGKK